MDNLLNNRVSHSVKTWGHLMEFHVIRSRSPARPPGLELESGLWKIVLLVFQDLHSLSHIFSCLHFFFLYLLHFSQFLSLCGFSVCSFWTWPNVAIWGLISMFSPLKYLHQLESSSLWLKTAKEKDLAGLPRLWLPLGSDHFNQLKP